MIISGRMRERVTVQRPMERQSPSGEATLEWQTVSTVWAQVRNLTARDYFAAQQAGTLATHRILMRFFNGLTPDCRMIWRGRTMEITSISEGEDRREHEVFCKEEVR
jgi:SPP1 family predicted phage head-tail adaptor